MPAQATHLENVCPNCDGFPVVAVDSGLRNPDGTRQTLNVVCPGCEGAGKLLRPLLAKVGAPC